MKKIILTVLTLIVFMSSINFASDISEQISGAQCITEYDDDTDIENMDTVTFGSYPQFSSSSKEPIEWLVLDKQGDKALLLSKYILNFIRYSKSGLDISENSTWNWANSNFREWLNNDFLSQAFSNDETKCLVNDRSFGDKVFILNRELLKKYFNIYSYNWVEGLNGAEHTPDDSFKINYFYKFDEEINKISTVGTEYAVLNRGFDDTIYLFYDNDNTPELIDSTSIGRSDGTVDDRGGAAGVRPAIWVSLSNSSTSHTNSDSLGEYIDFFGEKVYSGGEINRVNGKDAKVTGSAWEQLPAELKEAFKEDQIIDDASNNSSNQSSGLSYGNLSEQIAKTRTYIEIKGNNRSTVNHDIESVTFGRYKYANSETPEPLQWIVLDKKDGKALLTTKYILLDKEFESVRRLSNKSQEILAEGTTWGLSSLRNWLNNDFYNDTFSNDERKLILITKNKNESLYFTDEDYDDTEDKVFLLSIEEGTVYSTENGANSFKKWQEDPWYSYNCNISLIVAPLNSGHRKTCKEGCSKHHPTWTRTMGKKKERYNGIEDICLQAYGVTEENDYSDYWADNKLGIRPVICVKYDGPASSITIPDVSANSTSNVKSISNSNNVRKTLKQDVINSENNVADEVIDLDARNYVNKQEDIKESETKKQETIKQENRKTDETHKIPKYILDSWAKNDMSASEPDKFILSDDGYTIKYQITRGMLENSGVETELSVVVPGHEYDFISKTYPEVTFFADYRKAWDDHKSEEYKIASKICDSYILSIDDGVNGKYDYDMLKRLGAGRIWFTQFMLPTTSKKEAKRIAEELNKKLDEDGFFTIIIQYKETDKDMGEYAVNPIYIGKGKAVVKKEGFLFPKLSMYVEFEGEAKKLLEKYTKENKEKYLILTDGFIDDGTRATEGADIKYNDSFQDEINKIFSSDNVRENDDYNTKQLITKTISNGKVYVNMLGIEFMNKNSKIFTDIDVGYEYALKVAKVFPTDLYIVDRMEYYTK